MDVHCALQHGVRRLGVQQVEDAVDGFVAAHAQYGRAEDFLGVGIDGDFHEALGFAFFNRAAYSRHRAFAGERDYRLNRFTC